MSAAAGKSDWRLLPESISAKVTGVHESLLQESEKDVLWYRDNFLGKPHLNFLTPDSPRGPLAISLIKDGSTYKALVRSNTGADRLSVAANKVKRSTLRRLLGFDPTLEHIISAMGYVIPSHYLKFCKDPNLPNELLAMEERQVIRSYKFGVEYAAAGQTTEEQALSNTHANNTGTHSVYTKWQGYEVMYHVSTLLPHKPEDKQQLERKRHIGNDIVVIIFQDGKDVFDLSSISSHQNHVVAMVCPDGDGYRVQFAGKVGVPPFTPDIPDPPLIQSDPVSRDFFLHKLVNAERASYKAPSFAPKLSRTRSVLLYDIAVKFLG